MQTFFQLRSEADAEQCRDHLGLVGLDAEHSEHKVLPSPLDLDQWTDRQLARVGLMESKSCWTSSSNTWSASSGLQFTVSRVSRGFGGSPFQFMTTNRSASIGYRGWVRFMQVYRYFVYLCLTS